MDGRRTTLFLVVQLLCVLYLVRAYDPSTCIQCRKSHVCNPPDCFCCRDTMPLEAKKIPQMVFFTFDDAVNPAVAKHYQDLFDASRLNPNGCPVRMTLFISHRNTVYSYVRDFYERGMEIASHSVTHSHPNSQTFLREAKKQKENLARKAKIPESEIVGWRSPFLEPLGDTQPKVLKQLGYKYDATLTITKKSNTDKAITPFTLDHGWPYDCKIKPCPSQSHNGFWEVPVVSVKDYKNKYDCVYIDACHSPPPSENTAYKFLWDNFQRYYSTNRAPMGINMHASWFYYPDRKAAMDKFIKQLVKMDDVYILTIKQVIDWLKDPTPLNKIKTFLPWQCGAGSNETIGKVETKTLTNPVKLSHARQPIGTKITPIQVKTKQTLPNQRQFNQNIQRQQVFTPTPQQTNMPMQPNAWQAQRQNQMQSNAFSRQQVGPTAVPYRPTSSGMQTPVWPRGNMNGLPPIPIPPMSPNFPAVRFWWRPPAMMDPQMQMEMRRREAMRRQRMLQEQQQSAIQQAQLQRGQRAEMLRRQAMIEKRRQNMMLQQKAEEERLRKEQLEKQKQEELKRQEILKQKELDRKAKEEERIRQERLQKEQLEKQKQEELAKQALLKQQQLEQQRIEEHLRQERIKQEQLKQEQLRQERIKREQLEKQRQEELRQKALQQQQEQQRRDEMLLQERLQKEELQRQEQLKQRQLENQRQEELQRQEILAKQKHEELRQQQLLTEQASAKFIQENQSITQPDMVNSNRNIKSTSDVVLVKKLDKMLRRAKKDRISMLQQMSLYELQLLQYEVNRRMTTSATPMKSKLPVSESTKHINSKQDTTGVENKRSQNQHVVNESLQEASAMNTNDGVVNKVGQSVSDSNVYPPSHLVEKVVPGIVTTPTTQRVLTTTTPSEETTTANVNQAPRSSTISVGHQSVVSNHISVTEKPRAIIQQKTIPVQFTVTTAPTVDLFANVNTNLQDVPFFNSIPPKVSFFEHQSVAKPPVIKSETTERTSVWNVDKFDIKSLHGPWKREHIPPMHEPGTTTKKPVRKTSLKLLPVAITLFNTDTFRQPTPQLSYKSFVRPNLFNPGETDTNVLSDEAVPVSTMPVSDKQPQPEQLFQKDTPYRSTFIEPVNILPLELQKPASAEHTLDKSTPTTSTTTTAATTTVPTTSTTSTPTTTTTTPPPTTTTTKRTTVKQTIKHTQQPFTRQQFTPRQKSIMTLVPIPIQWRLDKLGGPVAIPPYRPFPSSTSPRQSSTSKNQLGCRQSENCALPNCFCKTESVPLGMKLREIPQMVYITIDGSLNFHGLAKIRKLFHGRTNPNGCKVKGTMFITDAGSSYRISNLLLSDGIELAMMGMSSRPYTTTDQLTADMLLQRKRISDTSNIPQDRIHGWRSPGFKSLGDDQFSFMANESLYDSSLVLDRSSRDKQKLWPFTLDYGLNEHCEIGQCPSKHHQGMWEVPVIPYLGPNNSSTCEYVDGCTTQPKTATDTFNYLMDNFNMHYKTNRAPFAIRLKQIWFHWYYRENLKGLFSFLDTVLGYGDVYVSTISDMLQWIKNPVKLQNIDTFKPWKC